ncbi:MAG TPA: hypothetical protein VMT80_00485 [Candidatus Paceibacterota bacterium]|nr:hypothetical protein [Candidatus Paceibacterota bacterium]
MTLKVLGTVASCGECPNYGYYSGNAHECKLVEHVVVDKNRIAPFCPLADFPSKLLADMDATIRGLREPYTFAFPITLLTHVATRLKVPIHENGRGLTIPFKDGGGEREVYLSADYITGLVLTPGFEIEFMAKGDKRFKLLPDTHPPQLCEAVPHPEKVGECLWRHYHLAS